MPQYRAERNYENLNKGIFQGTTDLGIPYIAPEDCDVENWISFNYAKTAKEEQSRHGVHFFIDDYLVYVACWTTAGTTYFSSAVVGSNAAVSRSRPYRTYVPVPFLNRNLTNLTVTYRSVRTFVRRTYLPNLNLTVTVTVTVPYRTVPVPVPVTVRTVR